MKRLAMTNRMALVPVTLLLIVGLVFWGTGATNAAGKLRSPHTHATMKTLRWWGNFGDQWVKSLDPAVITDSLSIGNVSLIQANLVKTDYPSLKIVPDLATWKVSKNHRVYFFHINPKAKFSNGDPVTAE